MKIRTMLTTAALVALVACGGGGDGEGVTSAPGSTALGSGVALGTGYGAAPLKLAASANDPLGFDPAMRPLALSPFGRPPAVVTPNSITLQSERGDEVGGGANYAYSQSNALITVAANQGALAISVNGDQVWYGDFKLPSALAKLQVGSYSNLGPWNRFWVVNVPANGGLSWSGGGPCSGSISSLTISSVSYIGDVLEAIDLNFEQRCNGSYAALLGQIHWSIYDDTAAPSPVNPLPPGLWAPAAGTTPISGNYVYLSSDFGDWLGQGRDYLYTRSNASLGMATNAGITTPNGNVMFSVTGDEHWRGDFVTMNGLSQLRPGYYGDLQRYGFQNPVKGGMAWAGEGRACNKIKGWFVVDAVTYIGDELKSIDLRFEQKCEGNSSALRGQIHWTADDTTAPPGPINPPPASLWAPAAGATPSAGNYVYLVSDANDWVGNGGTYLYTPANANVEIATGVYYGTAGSLGGEYFSAGRLSLRIPVFDSAGTYSWEWRGDFAAMSTLSQLQPGYYGDLQRFAVHNPAKGGLDVSGGARGCNTLRGWFAVDAVIYVDNELKSIDFRFEQHCEGVTPALRGKVHWVF